MNNYKKNAEFSPVSFLCGLISLCFVLLFHASVSANETSEAELDQKVELLRSEASNIERDLGLLEKELLFPPLTRVEFYLSIQPDLDFSLRSVALELDGEEKSFHIYSQDDMTALQLGGLQHFWEGNVALGKHRIVATFKGSDTKGNMVKQSITHEFEKTTAGAAFELQVVQGKNLKTPDFVVKSWGKR